jgi:hypothetical protein
MPVSRSRARSSRPFGSVPTIASGSTGICCERVHEATEAAAVSRPAGGAQGADTSVAARTLANVR